MGFIAECGPKVAPRRREAIVEDRGEKAERCRTMTTAITDQIPRDRSRSERKRTAKTLSAICELVKKGLSVSHAAEKLHLHHTTVGRWRKELPDFDTAILAAEAEFIDSQVANIRTAATKNWQAAAWL